MADLKLVLEVRVTQNESVVKRASWGSNPIGALLWRTTKEPLLQSMVTKLILNFPYQIIPLG
jgi:hypothetical protein